MAQIQSSFSSQTPHTPQLKVQNLEHLNPDCSNSVGQLDKKKDKKFSKWTLQQNVLYASAVQSNLESFDSETMRRRRKVFHIISSYVKTKTPNQCRSHHQKMIYRYNDLQGVIHNILNRKNEAFLQKEKKKISIVKCEVKEEEVENGLEKGVQNLSEWMERDAENAKKDEEKNRKVIIKKSVTLLIDNRVLESSFL